MSHLLSWARCPITPSWRECMPGLMNRLYLFHILSGEHSKDDGHTRVLTSTQQTSSCCICNCLIVCCWPPHLQQLKHAVDIQIHRSKRQVIGNEMHMMCLRHANAPRPSWRIDKLHRVGNALDDCFLGRHFYASWLRRTKNKKRKHDKHDRVVAKSSAAGASFSCITSVQLECHHHH